MIEYSLSKVFGSSFYADKSELVSSMNTNERERECLTMIRIGHMVMELGSNFYIMRHQIAQLDATLSLCTAINTALAELVDNYDFVRWIDDSPRRNECTLSLTIFSRLHWEMVAPWSVALNSVRFDLFFALLLVSPNHQEKQFEENLRRNSFEQMEDWVYHYASIFTDDDYSLWAQIEVAFGAYGIISLLTDVSLPHRHKTRWSVNRRDLEVDDFSYPDRSEDAKISSHSVSFVRRFRRRHVNQPIACSASNRCWTHTAVLVLIAIGLSIIPYCWNNNN